MNKCPHCHALLDISIRSVTKSSQLNHNSNDDLLSGFAKSIDDTVGRQLQTSAVNEIRGEPKVRNVRRMPEPLQRPDTLSGGMLAGISSLMAKREQMLERGYVAPTGDDGVSGEQQAQAVGMMLMKGLLGGG